MTTPQLRAHNPPVTKPGETGELLSVSEIAKLLIKAMRNCGVYINVSYWIENMVYYERDKMDMRIYSKDRLVLHLFENKPGEWCVVLENSYKEVC